MLRTLGRIAIGAGLGCAIATAFLVVVIFVIEYAYVNWGLRYEDITLAYFSWGVLMAAPIVGGWLAWVRPWRGVSHDAQITDR